LRGFTGAYAFAESLHLKFRLVSVIPLIQYTDVSGTRQSCQRHFPRAVPTSLDDAKDLVYGSPASLELGIWGQVFTQT